MINMKKWSILLVVAVALMESCSKEKKTNNSVKDHKDTIAAVQTPKNKPVSGASDLVVKGDSVVIPDFKIELNQLLFQFFWLCLWHSFPGQGLNPSHSRDNAESLTSRAPGNSFTSPFII